MQPARIHNLRGNKAERSPHRLFIWDTETCPIHEDRREVHQLRLWCAEVVQRHERRPTQPAIQPLQGTTGPELLDALESACRSTETLWAFAHNLGFDLAVTRLPLHLINRGWTITAHALTTPAPWARLSRGSHRLTLVDSSSWLPGALAQIGVQVDITKPELPNFADPEQAWYWRCRQDVAILCRAVCQLLDWWDKGKRGAWSITGPQTGFNALRHIPTPHKVVIDPDPEARAFERQAIHGGRREVWRLGRQARGDYREIDFQLAHATLAAHCPLPKRRVSRFASLALDDWRLTSDRWAPIAEALIETTVPRYPLEVGGRLFYPVGRFWTILCGPELAEASRRRELRQLGRGYIYQLGQIMGRWGQWVISELQQERESTPPVCRTAIKGWTRTVPGKWAGRTGRTHLEGPAAERGWALEHGKHHPSSAPVAILDMAGRRQVVIQDQEADDSFPAVLAWIQSEVRVRLGRLVDHIGPNHMVSCNTDGVLCDKWPGHAQRLSGDDLWPLVPREKARYDTLDVISPQHVVLDGTRRLSGVPSSGDEVAPHVYRWMTWPRLNSQIADGDSRGYVRNLRTADLTKVPVNRWVLADGLCMPVQAEVGGQGEVWLQRPLSLLDGFPVGDLGPHQHPVLAALLKPAEA